LAGKLEVGLATVIAFNALRIPDAKLLGALSIFAKCQAAT